MVHIDKADKFTKLFSCCESKERGKVIRVVGRKPSVMVSRKNKIRLHIKKLAEIPGVARGSR
jgi:hypothetical protein